MVFLVYLCFFFLHIDIGLLLVYFLTALRNSNSLRVYLVPLNISICITLMQVLHYDMWNNRFPLQSLSLRVIPNFLQYISIKSLMLLLLSINFKLFLLHPCHHITMKMHYSKVLLFNLFNIILLNISLNVIYATRLT